MISKNNYKKEIIMRLGISNVSLKYRKHWFYNHTSVETVQFLHHEDYTIN